MGVILLDDKAVDEVIPVSVNFSNLLASIDSVVISISVRSGVDNNPSALLFNSAEIKGASVSQLLQNGIEGVIYKIKFMAISGELRYSEYAYITVKEPV